MLIRNLYSFQLLIDALLIRNKRRRHGTRSIDTVKQFLIKNKYLQEDTPIDLKMSLLENGLIDSVAVVKLMNLLEEVYHINIEDEELVPENFDTLEGIDAFVRNKTRITPSHIHCDGALGKRIQHCV